MDELGHSKPPNRGANGRFVGKGSNAYTEPFNISNLLADERSNPSTDSTTHQYPSRNNDNFTPPPPSHDGEGILPASTATGAVNSSTNTAAIPKKKRGRPRKVDSGSATAATEKIQPLKKLTRSRNAVDNISVLSTPAAASKQSGISPLPSKNNTKTPTVLGYGSTPSGHPVSIGTASSTVSNSAYNISSADLKVKPSRKRPPPPQSFPSLDTPSNNGKHLKRPRVTNSLCIGLYSGNFAQALSFAGQSMLETGCKLLEWSRESDFGKRSFMASPLFTSKSLLLPFHGMNVKRALDTADGFMMTSDNCTVETCMDIHANGNTPSRCEHCNFTMKKAGKIVQEIYKNTRAVELSDRKTRIDYIAKDPALAEKEIRYGRKEIRRLRRELAKTILEKEMKKKAILVSHEEGKEMNEVINMMSDSIETRLESGGDVEACELWKIHWENLNQHYANGGKSQKKKVPVHPILLNWAIAFLAKNSATMYREVQKIMLLPSISYVYRKMKELVSTSSDKGYSIHIQTLETLSKRANDENWSKQKRTGCIAQDSANIKMGVEHDYMTNEFVGGDESHKIGTLSQMFGNMAKEVKDSAAEDEVTADNPKPEQPDTQRSTENSILDEMRLAKEHLVFKWTTIDPDGYNKESFIIASINIEKVTPELVATAQEVLQDTLPAYGLTVAFGTADAAGCNWVGYNSLATLPISTVLPKELMDKYPSIDFNLVTVYEDPITGGYVIFIPDMPHLTKNIVTALELSGSRYSKRELKFGKCSVNLIMVEDVWLKSGGATNQLHESKLTVGHLHKNAYSRMNVALAAQILSATVCRMIRNAIKDDSIVLMLRNKDMYSHLADLCEHWNLIIDLCNGRDGPHTPDNAAERQTQLLDVLDWFTKWKNLHDERVAEGEATEYNFFADETWFCIRALILGHVAAIQIYCVEKKEKIRPRSITTDVVEWFFADGRQMVGGSTNKMSARAWNHSGAKSTAFMQARHNVVGNNKTGAVFERNARF